LDWPDVRNSSLQNEIERDEFRPPARSTVQMGSSLPYTVAVAIRGPIARDDLPGLCERVCTRLRDHPGSLVVCDVCGVEPDAVVVDALARLQLAARRHGCRICLRGASPELHELVGFMGLSEVLCG
jgi:STAS domain